MSKGQGPPGEWVSGFDITCPWFLEDRPTSGNLPRKKCVLHEPWSLSVDDMIKDGSLEGPVIVSEPA